MAQPFAKQYVANPVPVSTGDWSGTKLTEHFKPIILQYFITLAF